MSRVQLQPESDDHVRQLQMHAPNPTAWRAQIAEIEALVEELTKALRALTVAGHALTVAGYALIEELRLVMDDDDVRVDAE